MLPKQQHFLYNKSMNCKVPVTACKYRNSVFTKEFPQITKISSVDSATPNFLLYICAIYRCMHADMDIHMRERKKASFRQTDTSFKNQILFKTFKHWGHPSSHPYEPSTGMLYVKQRSLTKQHLDSIFSIFTIQSIKIVRLQGCLPTGEKLVLSNRLRID